MAISTYKVYLMHKGSSDTAFSKLIDIKEFPDIGGDPELLETTTLSDAMQTFILGIQANEGLAFTANYTKSDYTTLNALAGKNEHYAIWFGATVSNNVLTPDGSNGKFSFDGELAVHVSGGGVNEVVDMAITIAPTTVISFE